MKANEFVNAKYLTAKNLNENKGKKVVIDAAFSENISGQDKLCIRFKGIDNPLPLNQTNLSILIAEFGDDTDKWINHSVTLNVVKVQYNGQMVDGIQLGV